MTKLTLDAKMKINQSLELEMEGVKNKKKKVEKQDKNSFYYESFNIGFYLIAPLISGVFLGLLIDKSLNTKPIFTITLIIFGAIGSFYNLYKLTKKE